MKLKLFLSVIYIVLSLNVQALASTKPLVVFDEKDCLNTGIKPQKFNSGQIIFPRYDGENYFIDSGNMKVLGDVETPKKSQLEIEQIIANAKNVIDLGDLNSFLNGNSSVDFTQLPLVIKVKDSNYQKLNCHIVITSLIFTTSGTKAEIGIISESSIKNSIDKTEKLYLGAILDLGKGGQISGALKLISPKEIPLFDLKNAAKINLTVGTGICLGCKESDGLALKLIFAGSIDFNPNIAIAINPDGTPATGDEIIPKLNFAVNVASWDDLYISLSFPIKYGIQFKVAEGLTFRNTTDLSKIPPPDQIGDFCTFSPADVTGNIILDLSSTRSPANEYKKDLAGPWSGLFMQNIEVDLPKGFRKPNSTTKESLSLLIDYFYFDDSGLNTLAGIRGKNGTVFKMGDAFDIQLDMAKVQIDKNKLTGFELGGGFRFPFQKQDNLKDYKFHLGFLNVNESISVTTRQLTLGIFSTPNAGQEKDFNILGAKFLNCGTDIKTTITNWDFDKIDIGLSGLVLFNTDLEEDDKTVKGVLSNRPNYYFDNLIVSTEAPYLKQLNLVVTSEKTCPNLKEEKPAEKEKCNDAALSIAGFRFGMQSLSLVANAESRKAIGSTKVQFQLGRSCNETTTLPMIEAGALLRFETDYSFDDNGRLKFKLKDIGVTGIAVKANFTTFSFDGEATLFKNQPAFDQASVSGFQGTANLTIKLLGDKEPKERIGAGISMMFLTVNPGLENEYKSWAVDASASGLTIPMGPAVTLKGIFGGAYKNAIALNLESKSIGNKTGIQYSLREKLWGFNFGLDLAVVGKADLTAMVAAEGNTNGLKFIKGIAYAKFKVEGKETKSAKDQLGKKEGGNGQFVAAKDETGKVANASQQAPNQSNLATKAIDIFTKGQPAEENIIGAGAILTVNFGNYNINNSPGYFQLILYPYIKIHFSEGPTGASLQSTGYGELYISNNLKFFHLGKQQLNERLGFKFNSNIGNNIEINAWVKAYLMLGDQINTSLPPPVIPPNMQMRFNEIAAKNSLTRQSLSGYEEVSNGTGFAAGFALGININFTAKKVLNASLEAGAGIDLLLVQRVCPGGWVSDNTKTWRGAGQLYGYATGGLNVFGVSLAELGMGFLLKASVPQPVYAEGTFLVYAKVWKASTSFKIHAKVGEDNSETNCQLPENQIVEVKPLEMIENLSPAGNSKLSQIGNLYVSLVIPEDQKASISDANALDNFKLKVKLTLTPKGGGEPIETVLTDLDPLEYFDKDVKIPTSDLGLVAGIKYDVTVYTEIYSTTAFTINSEYVEDENEIQEYEAGHVVLLDLEDGTRLELKHEKEFEIEVSEGFDLTEKDLLVYPAKNMSNVYIEEYGGNGFVKFDESVFSNFQTKCAGCTLNIGVFQNSIQVGIERVVENTSMASFPIQNLNLNTVYEIRLWLIDNTGQTKKIYSNHFFKTDQHYRTFSTKIAEVNTNNTASFTQDFNFKVESNVAKSFDSFFSNEEYKEMITMKPKEHNWFRQVETEYYRLSTNTLTYNEIDQKYMAFQQSQYGGLDGNLYKLSPTSFSSINPIWIYKPFDPTIYKFYDQVNNNNKTLVAQCGMLRGATLPDGSDGGIPCFEVGDYCFSLTYDLAKLMYYKESNITLPTNYQAIKQAEICFENKKIQDFNLESNFKKTLKIVCQQGKLDSEPNTYAFSMLNSTGQEIDFPENFSVNYANSIFNDPNDNKTFEEKFEFESPKSPVSFQSLILGSQGCPLNAEGFELNDDKGNESFKYQITYEKAPIEPIVPCITIKRVVPTFTMDNNFNGIQIPEFSQGISFGTTFLIESWESEAAKGSKRQKIRGMPITLEIYSKLSIEGGVAVKIGETTITEQNGSEIIFNYNDLAIGDVYIKVTDEARFTCGDNITEPVETNFKTKAFLSFAKNKQDACLGTNSGELYYSGETIEKKLTQMNKTKDFYPTVKADKGFYKTSTNEVYVINNEGLIQSIETCNKYFVEFSCSYYENNGLGSISATVYKDNTKTSFATPNDFLEKSINVTFNNSFVGTLDLSNLTYGLGTLKIAGASVPCSYLPVVAISSANFEFSNGPVIDCNPMPAAPTLSVSNSNANLGENITLTANGCVSGKYLWQNKPGVFGNTISEIATTSKKYRVYCLENNCLSGATEATVNIVPLSIKASDGKKYLCQNETKVLLSQGCSGQLNWRASSPNVNFNSNNGGQVEITNFTENTTIYLDCSVNSNDETFETTASLALNLYQVPLAPAITSTLNPNHGNQLCLNSSVSITTTTNCQNSNIVWSSGETSSSLTVSPAENKTYTAKCTNNYCFSNPSNPIDLKIISPDKPIITVTNAYNNNVCTGQSATLSSSCNNGEEVFWYLGNSNRTLVGQGPTLAVSFTSGQAIAKMYSARCGKNLSNSSPSASDWCYGSYSSFVTLNEIPAVNVALSIDRTDICSYQNANLVASQCSQGIIEWIKPGESQWTTSINNFSTQTAGVYKVRCNLNNNCFNAGHVSNNDIKATLSVYNEPAKPSGLSSGDNDNAFCNGTAITLTGTCESGTTIGWEWQNGTALSSSSNFKPVQDETYFSFCQKSVSASLTCRTQPNNRVSLSINVHSIPEKPTVNSSNGWSICEYNNTNISASGCNADGINGTLLWVIDGGNETSSPTLTNINQNHSYKVRCQVWECSSEWSDLYQLSVNSRPAAPGISSNKNGFTCNEAITLTASGCIGTVNWSNGSTGSSITLTNVQKSKYTAKCTDTNGCDSNNSNEVEVEIREIPALPSISGNTSYCAGAPIALSASSNGASVNWTNYNETNRPTPAVGTHTYTAYSSKNGCSSDNTSFIVTVFAYPNTPNVTPTYNCGGTNLSINNCAGGTAYFKWNGNIENNGFSSTSNTREYLTFCEINGCTTQGSNYIPTVIYSPVAPVLSPNKTTLCNGENTNIVVTAGNGSFAYIKKVGETETSGINFNAITESGTYFVRTTNSGNGLSCSAVSNEISINAYSATTPSVSAVVSNCTVLFTGTNCNGEIKWHWVDNNRNQNYISTGNTLTNNQYTEYTAICYNNGCPSPTVTQDISGLSINRNPIWGDRQSFQCYDQETDVNSCSPSYNTTRRLNEKSTSPNWQLTSTNSDMPSPKVHTYTDNNACSPSANETKFCRKYRIVTGRFQNYSYYITRCNGVRYYVRGTSGFDNDRIEVGFDIEEGISGWNSLVEIGF
jgi:hypothetical protein